MKPSSTVARRRLWFDISTLTRCPVQPTGIPRVLRSLTHALATMPQVDAVFCAIDERGDLRRVAPDLVLARFHASETRPRPPKFVDRLTRIWRSRAPDILAPMRTSDLGPQDTLVSLGGGWTSDPGGHVYRRLRRRTGARIAVVLYDLIPVLFPHYFPSIVDRVFRPWFRAMAGLADNAIAISQRTAQDFHAYCSRQGIRTPPLDLIRLGDDSLGAMSVSQLPPEIGMRPFVLSVGTVEIRKNHRLLIEVWKNLLQEHDPVQVPMLVIAGSQGWLADGVIPAVRQDSRLREHVRFVHDLDDARLARLYERCLWTMYPSRYEGWGLPVGESLCHGKICIASNAASIPEIAGPLTDLHEPDDAWSCQRLVERYLFDEEGRRRREREIRTGFRRTGWHDTATELVGHLTRTSEPFMLGRAG